MKFEIDDKTGMIKTGDCNTYIDTNSSDITIKPNDFIQNGTRAILATDTEIEQIIQAVKQTQEKLSHAKQNMDEVKLILIKLDTLIEKFQKDGWIDCTEMDAFAGDEFETVIKYLKENKQLKETLENTINQLTLRNDSVDNLTDKLEKIKELTDRDYEYVNYGGGGVDLQNDIKKILGRKNV